MVGGGVIEVSDDVEVLVVFDVEDVLLVLEDVVGVEEEVLALCDGRSLNA